jgi:flagellar hook-basal body complex protein FliE
MVLPVIAALGAGLSQLSTSPPAPTTSAGATAGASFDQTLSQVVSDAVGTLRAGEAAAIQGVNGTMPTFKVVESIMSAQRTLQQAISIRDKAVSAYQEITRMTV